jgi:hypothetical protein
MFGIGISDSVSSSISVECGRQWDVQNDNGHRKVGLVQTKYVKLRSSNQTNAQHALAAHDTEYICGAARCLALAGA